MSNPEGPFFVRQSRGGNWDAISEATPEDLTFPADVLGDVVDPDCQTSVWKVERLDSPEIDYLVPALIPRSNSNFQEMRFKFISLWRLDKLELTKRQTVGTSLDDQLNKKSMHWIIDISTVQQAIRFAKGLTVVESRVYTKEEVMARFASSLSEQRLQIKNVNKELVVHLVKERHLRYTNPPAEAVAADAPPS